MNFGDRSIVAKAITLRFVVVLGRLDLELPWIFFADQIYLCSFDFYATMVVWFCYNESEYHEIIILSRSLASSVRIASIFLC